MTHIRKAIPEDRQVIIKYVSDMIGGSDRVEVAVKEVDKFFQQSCYSVYIAEVDSIPIGFESVKSDSIEGADAVSEIVFTYIDDKHRRKGSGSELVRGIELDFKNQGIQKLYTKVNVSNIRASCFWISQGYQFESRLLRLNQGIDYYVLGKEL